VGCWDLAAYRKPAEFLGLDPAQVMLAAAHNGDLAGAREAGLATAFIIRPDEGGPGAAANAGPAADWDFVATSLTDLAGQL
jgi:2-haloacid dehalogenase